MRRSSTSPVDGVRSSLMMGRRDFLVLGSVVAVGAAANGLSADVAGTLAGTRRAASISVGYWDGPVGGGETRRATLRAPISAEIVPMGDPRFLRSGARVNVLGFWRADRNRNKPVSISLGAWYAVAGAGKVPVVAWTYSANRSGAFAGGRSSFLVPVDGTGAMELSLEAIETAPQPRLRPAYSVQELELQKRGMESVPAISSHDQLAENDNAFSFAVDYGRGMKLQPGVYIFAVRSAAERAPDWSSLHVADLTKPESLDPNGKGPLTQSFLIASGRPDFDYLMLGVELGK